MTTKSRTETDAAGTQKPPPIHTDVAISSGLQVTLCEPINAQFAFTMTPKILEVIGTVNTSYLNISRLSPL